MVGGASLPPCAHSVGYLAHGPTKIIDALPKPINLANN